MLRLPAIVCAVAVFASATIATAAPSASRYASIGIENRTEATITFSYVWEGRPTRTGTLAPGEKRTFWVKYAPENQSRVPKFNVRFDADGSGKALVEKKHLLKNPCADDGWACAKKYVFKSESEQDRTIDLYAAQ